MITVPDIPGEHFSVDLVIYSDFVVNDKFITYPCQIPLL
jgi:hypothetical protein